MKKVLIVALLLIPMSLFAQKFGYVNSALVAESMPEYIKAKSDLQTLEKQYSDEYNRLRDEFTKKSEDYNQVKDSLPANILQRREQELQDLYSRLQQYEQESYEGLQQARQLKMSEVSTKLTKAVQAVGVEGGYVCVFDLGAGIPYISETLCEDVTAKVKAKLGIQ